jgi:hypothetical protein
LRGRRLVEVTEFKTKKKWVKFIKRISDEFCPNAEKTTLVMDNFKTHDPSAFYEAFEQKGFGIDSTGLPAQFVYTPKHGSWRSAAAVEYGRTGWPEP